MRIGIDLGGTNIAAGLVNDDMKIVCKSSLPTKSERPYTEIVKDMAALVMTLVDKAGIPLSDVESVGIGCPGTPVVETGEILYSNNLGWENVPLLPELAKYIKQPLRLDNDANCAALGETLAGAAKGTRSTILLTLGPGVGGGIILDGKVYAGINHAGAELGHTVIVSGGEPCTCGRRGCLEAYASATALIRMGKKAAAQHPDSLLARAYKENGRLTGLLIFDALDKGDEAAKEVVDTYLFYLAEGITNFVNIFQPEAVILGGGISAQGEKILVPLRRQVAADVFCKQVSMPKILCATLGNDAGIIGAALL